MACGMREVLCRRGVRWVTVEEAPIAASAPNSQNLQMFYTGEGSHPLLTPVRLWCSGIMNGLDTVEWDPARDEWLPVAARFQGPSDVVRSKAEAKRKLQLLIGLAVDPQVKVLPHECNVSKSVTSSKSVSMTCKCALGVLHPMNIHIMILSRVAGAPASVCRPPDETKGHGCAAVIPAGALTHAAAAACRCSLLLPPAHGVSPLPPTSKCTSLLTLCELRQRQLACKKSASRVWQLHGTGITGQRVGPVCCADPSVDLAAEGVAMGGLQVALLGTGEPWMERALAALSSSFPGRAAGVPKFDELLAHLLMAAADYVIVPSRFEPCGLVAQSAARYGAVPIVTAVGGLRDFVTPEVLPLSNDLDRCRLATCQICQQHSSRLRLPS